MQPCFQPFFVAFLSKTTHRSSFQGSFSLANPQPRPWPGPPVLVSRKPRKKLTIISRTQMARLVASIILSEEPPETNGLPIATPIFIPLATLGGSPWITLKNRQGVHRTFTTRRLLSYHARGCRGMPGDAWGCLGVSCCCWKKKQF